MFAHLQGALNKIWEVKTKPGRSMVVLVKDRMLSFGIVILSALALLGTLVIDTGLNTVANRGYLTMNEVMSTAETAQAVSLFSVSSPLNSGGLVLLRLLQLVMTVTVTTGLIAVIYRVLPDVDISWEDVIVGSIFTAALLFVGEFAVGTKL